MRSVALICLTLLFFIPINKEELAFTNSPFDIIGMILNSPSLLSFEPYHCHITLCADAEGRTPERKATRNVYMCMGPMTVAMALLVDIISQERKRKYLPVMGVAREL